MAADLNTLIPGLRNKVQQLLVNCAARGIEMRPNEATRNPWRQARLWRQSRAIQEIEAKIALLNQKGAPYLAGILHGVGPQSGDPVTKALPGFSWHQWREACDCFWVVNGQAEWSTTKKVNGLNGYRVYAEEAVKLGLNAGGTWTSFKDWPHVQVRQAASPLGELGYPAIDAQMKQRWGATEPTEP